MAGPGSARRGQPLIALGTILIIWTFVRIAVWTPLFEASGVVNAVPLMRAGNTRAIAQAGLAPAVEKIASATPHVRTGTALGASPSGALRRTEVSTMFAMARDAAFLLTNPEARRRPDPDKPDPDRAVPYSPFVQPGATARNQRWSADGWLLLRTSDGVQAQAPVAASYGASQAGAVLRYRLGEADPHAPYVYARASMAIDAPGKDREIALGLGVRPLRAIPVRALVEARLQDSGNGPPVVRPVVAVVTELPWQALPLGMRGEVYAQAGYAGGRGSTAFFDAQALVDGPVAGVLPEGRDLRIGVGAWAGGQKGTMRLDIGPRASVALDFGGPASARVAFDWRIRVAGNARPGSGPALSVASSF